MPRVPRSLLVRLAAPTRCSRGGGASIGSARSRRVRRPSRSPRPSTANRRSPSRSICAGTDRETDGDDHGDGRDRHPVLRVVLPAARAHRGTAATAGARGRDASGPRSTAKRRPAAEARPRAPARRVQPRAGDVHRGRIGRGRDRVVLGRAVRSAHESDQPYLRRVRRDHRRRVRHHPPRRALRPVRDRDRRSARAPAIDPGRRRRLGHRVRAVGRRAEPGHVHDRVQVLQRGLVGTTATVAFLAVVEEAPEGARAYAASMLALAGGFGFSFSVVTLPFGDLASWGWRIPFALGGATIFFAPAVARATRRDRALIPRSRRTPRRPRPGARRASNGTGGRFVLLAVVAFLTSMFNAPVVAFMNKYLTDVRGFTNTDIARLPRRSPPRFPASSASLLGGRLAEVRGRRPVAAIALAVATGTQMIFFLTGGVSLWVDVGCLHLHGRRGRDRARDDRRRALPHRSALDVERDALRPRCVRVRNRARARRRPLPPSLGPRTLGGV